MPGRALIPARWLVAHVQRHPGRLLATSIAVLLASFVVLGYAMMNTLHAAREGRIDTCIALNELSRKIYITLGDFAVPEHRRAKYRPSTNCEKLP